MEQLRDVLLDDGRRSRVVADTVLLVNAEMASKRGLRSIPLKAAYKLVTNFKPGFVRAIVNHMLPEFCDALQPFYAEWLAKGDAKGSLEDSLKRQEGPASEALLGVADRRVEGAQVVGASAIKKAYRGLRGTARRHVGSALPGLARTVVPYLREAGVSG
ncbi:MAG: hypothetical protein JKY65_24525 [Planctomycetes bacterium]|nr:hypothetical protein [Planctomycetota bacterium]